MLFFSVDGFSFYETKIISVFSFLIKFMVQKDITFRTKSVIFKNSRFIFAYKNIPNFSYHSFNGFWVLFSLRTGYLIKFLKFYPSHFNDYTLISTKMEHVSVIKKSPRKSFMYLNCKIFKNLKNILGKLKGLFYLKTIWFYKKIFLFLIKSNFFMLFIKTKKYSNKPVYKLVNYNFCCFFKNIKDFIRYKTCNLRLNVFSLTKFSTKRKIFKKNYGKNVYNELNYIKNKLYNLFYILYNKIEKVNNCKFNILVNYIEKIVKNFIPYKIYKKEILHEGKNKLFNDLNILKLLHELLYKNKYRKISCLFNSHFQNKCRYSRKKNIDFKNISFNTQKIYVIKWVIRF